MTNVITINFIVLSFIQCSYILDPTVDKSQFFKKNANRGKSYLFPTTVPMCVVSYAVLLNNYYAN